MACAGPRAAPFYSDVLQHVGGSQPGVFARVSIQYERDNALRRIVITVLESAEPETIRAVVEQQSAGAGSFGILYDFRRSFGAIPIESLVKLHVSATRRDGGARGPVAILTANLKAYSAACKYVALAHAEGHIEVFHDREEAEAWLTDAT